MHYSHLLVLGGAGRAGRWLIRESLAAGYRVTAMVRNPSDLGDVVSPSLDVVRGDMYNRSDLEQALALGADAVVCTLGVYHKGPGTPLADMTANLVAVMKDAGVQRLVYMSSLGVGDSRGQGNLVVKYVTHFVLKHVLRDKSAQEAVVSSTGLDWTVLRPPRLVEQHQGESLSTWQGRHHPSGVRWRVSNRDAAREMLRLLEDEGSWHQAYQCSS